jgi:mevalonate kinase
MNIYVKVPGKLFLAGEYGILYGRKAIVLSIDRYTHINIETAKEDILHVHFMGSEYRISDINSGAKVLPKYVHGVLSLLSEKYDFDLKGIKIDIKSELGAKDLGSSAAVTAGLIGGLLFYFENKPPNSVDIIYLAYDVKRKVEGGGSIGDIAAVTLGGVIAVEDQFIYSIEMDYPEEYSFMTIYTRTKRDTMETMNRIIKLKENYPEIFMLLIEEIGEISNHIERELKKHEYRHIATLLHVHHGLLKALGASNYTIEEIIHEIDRLGGLGAKISGAEEGNCVIALCERGASYKIMDELTRKGYEGFVIKDLGEGLNIKVY